MMLKVFCREDVSLNHFRVRRGLEEESWFFWFLLLGCCSGYGPLYYHSEVPSYIQLKGKSRSLTEALDLLLKKRPYA